MLDDKERLAGYHLGLWLLGDQQRAEMAVSRAADKVSIADINAAANWKRTERNRARNPNGHRPNYRVRSQVFTRLLLTELEHEEKEQEKEIALTEKDCVQRSVKLLFRVSIEHNPFWAAVISCLVLGTPSARQTLSVYGAVAPDPEEKKDEPRCSRVKGSIIKLMAGRFGVRVEEVLHPDSSPLPTSDPRVSLIGGSFAKLLPLIDGDDVDLDRMRVFFDINRFNQVTHTLQLTSFEKCVRKLLIWDVLGARMPRMTKRIDTPDSVLNHIREFACREARRRSMLTRGPVSIRVAGVDRAVIADSGSVHSLVLECGAPTVELVGRDLDGEVVIAVYLLTYDGPKTEVWKVTLPWGEEIVCRLQYRDDDRVFAEMELRSTSEIAIPAGATPEMGQLERVRNGFRFGPFILDRDTCELYRNGEFYKHLRQQACTVLIALLERSPALVKREELIALVWGSGTKEPEFGLANIIGDLRKDLEDSKDHPQYVQVLGGLGIRFNASVDKLPATSVASGETHAVLADSPEIQSQLFDEVLTYLAELARVAAELPPYCPPHPTSSPCSATGFDSIRQSVQLVEDRTAFEDLQTADWEQMRAAGLDLTGLVHKPWRARLEEEEEKKETRRRLQKRRGPPVMVWDEKAGEGFHRAVILGDPGFGKTWLLRYEARRLARQGWLALQQRTISLEQLVLPIFLRLPDLAWSTSGIENGLVSAVGQPHTERFRSWVREKLQTEHCVIFLDAWDEVPTEAPKEGRVVEQLGHRQHLGRRLESFAWRFPRPRLLMTSRLAGYVGSPVPGAKELELLAFEKGQQEAFVGVWFGEEKAKGEAFLQVLRQNRQVRALGRIPLMLALMCRAYQEGQLSIPTRRVEVYDCCLRGLLRDWLGEKQRREVSDAYVDAQLELLQAVAYDLFREGYEQFGEGLLRTKMKPRLEKLSHTNELYGRTAESLIAEMKNDGILTTMVEHGEAKLIFLHRTFQEYLAARGLAKQENWLELALTHVYDSWWQEVLWLLGGVLEKQHPTEYVVALLQENRKDLLVRPLQLAVGAGCEARWDRLPSGLSGGLLKVALDLYLYAAPGIARERWLLLIECWAGQALRKLLALLQHHEPEVQRAVLKALGRMGLAEVPALLRQLDADIQETAARAAEALGRIGSVEAIPAVVRRLEDRDAGVREAAAYALGRIGSVEAVPALLRCLDGSMELAGAEALRRITQLNKMPLVPERATKNLRNWLDSLAHALEAVEADARRQ